MQANIQLKNSNQGESGWSYSLHKHDAGAHNCSSVWAQNGLGSGDWQPVSGAEQGGLQSYPTASMRDIVPARPWVSYKKTLPTRIGERGQQSGLPDHLKGQANLPAGTYLRHDAWQHCWRTPGLVQDPGGSTLAASGGHLQVSGWSGLNS